MSMRKNVGAVGLVEFKSIAKGIEATDAMLKAAHVQLVMSNTLCPGKYMSLISGEIGAVESAIKAGVEVGGHFTVDHYIIQNLSEDIFPALSATLDVDRIDALGIVETMSAVSSIVAADVAIKAATVELLEIRMARGLGGKGFTILTGDIAAVQSAIQACQNNFKEIGGIIAAVAIPSPTKDMITKVL